MPRYKMVNGERIQFTAEEEAARDAEETAWEAGAFDRAMADLRTKRNNLLSSSDWTAVLDTALTSAKKTEWQTYRTNLRNLTSGLSTVDDVNGVSFPAQPD